MFQSRHFRILPLAEGIYALEASEQGGAMSNAGIIDMGSYTLIFDTFNTPQAGKDLREAALQLLDQPIRYVINSHWHGDHVRGNQMFPASTIISSRRTRELMLDTQPGWLDRMRPLLPQLEADIATTAAGAAAGSDEFARMELAARHSYLLEIKESIETLIVTYPEVTFERTLTLHGSKRSVELISLGQAHTSCDSILHVPSDKLIFAGDVIAVNNHPLLTDGDPHSWLRALHVLERLNAQQIIPGHGPVSASSCIDSMKQYITDLLSISGRIKENSLQEEISAIPVPAL